MMIAGERANGKGKQREAGKAVRIRSSAWSIGDIEGFPGGQAW
jgi:hypothetical protein